MENNSTLLSQEEIAKWLPLLRPSQKLDLVVYAHCRHSLCFDINDIAGVNKAILITCLRVVVMKNHRTDFDILK